MRVLLDEHLDTTFRHHFYEGVSVETVGYRGWKGLENGNLLRAAEEDFDVLITMDGSIPHQNNLADFDLAVFVLRTTGDDLDALLDVLPALEEALAEATPGTYREVFPSEADERP